MKIFYRVLRDDDVEEILTLLNQHYEHVMDAYLGITEESNLSYFSRVGGFVHQGNSIGAFCKGKLVGCAVNAKVEDDEVTDYLTKINDDDKKYIRVSDALLDGEKVEVILGTSNYWEHKYVCVNRSFNGKGIWGNMLKMSLQLAKEARCEKLISFVTFDKNVSTAPDGNVVRKLKIIEFVDPVTGKKEFAGMKPPYTWMKLVVFDL